MTISPDQNASIVSHEKITAQTQSIKQKRGRPQNAQMNGRRSNKEKECLNRQPEGKKEIVGAPAVFCEHQRSPTTAKSLIC